MYIKNFFDGCRVLVTGATGTIGQELVRQLLQLPVSEVRSVDNNESALFFLGENYRNNSRLQVFLADVRDVDKMIYMSNGIDFVFHAAALKHVPLCERSPFDAVQTNIIGVQNIIQAAIANNVRKVLFTSSDKAVNSTNVMGTSKLMGERLITAANALRQGGAEQTFASTRFGNVAGSHGSVIPLFCQQIEQGGPITLTDANMTRFVMTLDDAIRLLMISMTLSKGGEVFVTKMPVVNIKDLAEVMIELLSPVFGYAPQTIEIMEIGARPGEKMYEELMNEEETRRALDTEQLFIILPAFRNIYENINYTYEGLASKKVHKAYNSAGIKPMDKDAIRKFLMRPNVLPKNIRLELKMRGVA